MAKALVDFVLHFGVPKRLHSDQGENFLSSVIKELCQLLNIDKSRTTYQPSGNGACERFNSTLLNLLGTLPNDQKDHLARHLGNIIHRKLTHQDDCAAKLSTFYGSVNKLAGMYGGLSGPTLCKLFNSFCCLFYGSPLWTFNAPSFANICVGHTVEQSRSSGSEPTTHTWL